MLDTPVMRALREQQRVAMERVSAAIADAYEETYYYCCYYYDYYYYYHDYDCT